MKFHHTPLLLYAAQSGVYGQTEHYKNGCITEAGFIYLDGEPSPEALDVLSQHWKNRMFIPLTDAWEQALTAYQPALVRTQRCQMQAGPVSPEMLSAFAAAIPEGYVLREFDAQAFDRHPFGHGFLFPDYARFRETGAGAVVWKDNEIVASASSFLSFQKETELDVSTLAAHRRRGLALACCAAMLLQCAQRDITVHWDAQNEASRIMAEKLGFTLDTAYTAYSFIAPEIP